MKGKMGLDLNSIKGLIVRHVEKVVLFGGGLFLLSLTYAAITHAGMPWDQDRLVDESQAAEQSVKSNPVPPDLGLEASADYVQTVQKLRIPVDGTWYQHPLNWTRTIFDGARMREEPPLFALKELRAAPGWGAVAINRRTTRNAAEPASPNEGQRWIVLTGIIPLKEQREAYKMAFEDAYRDPMKDTPKYVYYRVERAEVDPDDPGAEPPWKRIRVNDALDVQKFWRGMTQEIIHPMFISQDGPIVFPLPPVTNRTFGQEIAHEPTIPLYYVAPEVELPTDDAVEPGEDEPGLYRPPQSSGGMMGGYSGMMSGSGGMDEDMEYDDDMRSGGDMGSGGMGGYGGYAYGGSRSRQLVDAQLFRFFDFNVESGKSYRYRVQLMLENPNHDVPPEFLEKEELGDEQYLSAEFSDPSGMVAVPLDSRLLAVSVKSSLNPMVEPSAHLMSVHFDRETGEELAAEHERVYRGQVGNFLEIAVETPETETGGIYGDDMMGMMGSGENGEDMDDMMYGGVGGSGGRRPRERRTRRRAEPAEEVEKIDHLTEQTLLDMRGGQRLLGRDRDLTEPGMMLFLDSLGQLVVRGELEDLEEYMIYYVPEVEAPKAMNEQMMGGFGGEDDEGSGSGIEF